MAVIKTLVQNEYFQSLLILLGSIIFAGIFNFILKTYIKKLTERTKSDIDDALLKIITKPVSILIFVIGLYFSLKSLSILIPYSLWMDRMFFVIFVLAISLLASRILSFLTSRWLKVQKRFEKTPQLLNKIVTVVVYLIAVLMILSY